MEFLAGLLMGTVLGSAVALLLIPRSGRDVRHSLAYHAKRAAMKVSGIHPTEWREIVSEENSRDLVENLYGIRSAGL
jgi:gas vesicle protein